MVRASNRVRERSFVGRHPSGAPDGYRAILRSLAGRALDRVVDQPAHGTAGPRIERRTGESAPPDRAQDLAFLRDFRHRGGELAAAR